MPDSIPQPQAPLPRVPGPPPMLPLIATMPTKRVKGAELVEDLGKVPNLEALEFLDAFTTPWATDAHFITYQPVDDGRLIGESQRDGQEPLGWPRCNKRVLAAIRQAGADLHSTCLVFEWDRPGHRHWTEGKQGQAEATQFFRERILALEDCQNPLLAQWTLFYTTRAGIRLVYVLDASVPVDVAEQHYIWMLGQFRDHANLDMDPACGDWTRVFRLPCVKRDGAYQHEQGWFLMEIQDESRLPIRRLGRSSLTKVGKRTVVGPITEYEGEKPTRDQCVEMLFTVNEKGRGVPTEFFKVAKAQLKGRECFPALFENQYLAEPGSRNVTLTQYVGQAVSLLHKRPEASPEAIYALFWPAVEPFETEGDNSPDDPPWDDVLWSMVCRFWSREQAQVAVEKEKQATIEREAQTMEGLVLAGAREWCDDPALHGGEESSLEWLERRMILSVAGTGNHLIMLPSGYYDSMQVGTAQLISRLRETGMDRLVETRKYGDDGRVKDASPASILNRYAKTISHLEGQPELPGTVVRNLGGSNSVAVISLYRRNPRIKPVFNRDVDDWLRVLFGDYYKHATAWIGHALAWDDGPICALSIVGDPGVGKKMLVQGLAECMEIPRVAGADELIGDYQYGLAESPFLHVNEGWPLTRKKRPIDTFRERTGGDPIQINRKYLATMTARNPVRVLFTANNLNVIRGLIQGQELNPADREALAERLLHIETGDRAAIWLRAKGGASFTGRPGGRWIAGDGGGESDYIVARHFMWLYHNRPRTTGSRLLVTGNAMTELMNEMRTMSGSTPLVIEALLKLIESPSPSTRKGVAITKDGKVYALISGVLDYFRDNMAHRTSQKLTAGVIAEVFQSLVVHRCEKSWVLAGYESMGRKRWHELDCEMLLDVAERDGWESKRLAELVQKQRQGAEGQG